MSIKGIRFKSKQLKCSSATVCIILSNQFKQDRCQCDSTRINFIKSSIQTIILFLIRSTHVELDMLQPAQIVFWLGFRTKPWQHYPCQSQSLSRDYHKLSKIFMMVVCSCS